MSRVYKISSIDGEFLMDCYPPPVENEKEKQEEREEEVPTISPEEEREAILQEARREAQSIREEAKKKSKALMQDAQNKAQNLKKEAQKRADRLQDEARKKGLENGQKEGKKAFLKKSRELMNRLEVSLQEIDHRMKNYEEEYSTKVTELSLGIAKEVIRREVEEDPSVVMQVTREALSSMNGVAEAVIRVNWKDLEVMKEARDELLSAFKGLRRVDFQVDEDLEPGGTVIETPQGGIDASIATRFNKIKERLLEVMNRE